MNRARYHNLVARNQERRDERTGLLIRQWLHCNGKLHKCVVDYEGRFWRVSHSGWVGPATPEEIETLPQLESPNWLQKLLRDLIEVHG